jgi:hypothetical protein
MFEAQIRGTSGNMLSGLAIIRHFPTLVSSE